MQRAVTQICKFSMRFVKLLSHYFAFFHVFLLLSFISRALSKGSGLVAACCAVCSKRLIRGAHLTVFSRAIRKRAHRSFLFPSFSLFLTRFSFVMSREARLSSRSAPCEATSRRTCCQTGKKKTDGGINSHYLSLVSTDH